MKPTNQMEVGVTRGVLGAARRRTRGFPGGGTGSGRRGGVIVGGQDNGGAVL